MLMFPLAIHSVNTQSIPNQLNDGVCLAKLIWEIKYQICLDLRAKAA